MSDAARMKPLPPRRDDGGWIADGMALRRGDQRAVARILAPSWPGGSDGVELHPVGGAIGNWSRAEVAINGWLPVLAVIG